MSKAQTWSTMTEAEKMAAAKEYSYSEIKSRHGTNDSPDICFYKCLATDGNYQELRDAFIAGVIKKTAAMILCRAEFNLCNQLIAEIKAGKKFTGDELRELVKTRPKSSKGRKSRVAAKVVVKKKDTASSADSAESRKGMGIKEGDTVSDEDSTPVSVVNLAADKNSGPPADDAGSKPPSAVRDGEAVIQGHTVIYIAYGAISTGGNMVININPTGGDVAKTPNNSIFPFSSSSVPEKKKMQNSEQDDSVDLCGLGVDGGSVQQDKKKNCSSSSDQKDDSEKKRDNTRQCQPTPLLEELLSIFEKGQVSQSGDTWKKVNKTLAEIGKCDYVSINLSLSSMGIGKESRLLSNLLRFKSNDFSLDAAMGWKIILEEHKRNQAEEHKRNQG